MTTAKFDRLHFNGGAAVFDFTNTLNTRTIPATVDYIENYQELLFWAGKAGLLEKKGIKSLSELAEMNNETTAKYFKKIIKLREVLYRLFSSLANNKMPVDFSVVEFNKALGIYLSKIKLHVSASGAELALGDTEPSLDVPLMVIIKSAYEILTIESVEKIKECLSCGWLFVDRTKNGKRKWCDMTVCGSNDKAKKYYYRKKAATG